MKIKGGIDYSKWDNLDVSSSEDEDNVESNNTTTTPSVTRLDEPSTVTWSGDGSVHMMKHNHNDTIDQKKMVSKSSKISLATTTNSKESKKFFNLSRNGSKFIDSNNTTSSLIYWSQDRYALTISIPYLPNEIPSKSIRVSVTPKGSVLEYSRRYSAVGSGDREGAAGGEKGILSVKGTKRTKGGEIEEEVILFQGGLPHFIHAAQKELDDDETDNTSENEIDWEIINNTKSIYGSMLISEYYERMIDKSKNSDKSSTDLNLVQITLNKAVPMQGVTLWWSQPLLHCPEINTNSSIDCPDRNIKSDDEKKSKAGKSFSEVWKEAHEMFQNKQKNIK